MGAVLEASPAPAGNVLPARIQQMVDGFDQSQIGSLGLMDGIAADFAFDPALRGPRAVEPGVNRMETVSATPAEDISHLLNLGTVRHWMTERANAMANRRDEAAEAVSERLRNAQTRWHELRKRASRGVGSVAGLTTVDVASVYRSLGAI